MGKKKEPPNLVLIEKGNFYSAFKGNKFIMKVMASEPLTKEVVEEFRVNPESVLNPEPQEVA